ncbi:MAG: hypothetical protein JXB34_02395 [Bacteroidales bacterium]|nr:hypothetical protein [Bacteroidales bacterium]
MENNNEQLIVELRENIKKIVSLFVAEKEKRKNIEKKHSEALATIKELQEEKEKLRIQYDNLKIAKSLDASIINTHDAKLKVNRIVREIDKCIALLNK